MLLLIVGIAIVSAMEGQAPEKPSPVEEPNVQAQAAPAPGGDGRKEPAAAKPEKRGPVVKVGTVLSFEFKAKFQGDFHRSYEGADFQAVNPRKFMARRGRKVAF